MARRLMTIPGLGPVTASAIAVAQKPAQTAAEQTSSDEKPNILFIMGDDIGWMQPSIYHRGLMVGEAPNIDRIGQEGAIFMEERGARIGASTKPA
jgi:arylsulfatase